MKRSSRSGAIRSTVAYATLTAFGLQAGAAPISLSSAPASSAARLPAPNVIVTLDDSGSMDGDSMAALKQALNDTFAAANVPDGSIRLGWNAMNRCTAIPSAGDGCASLNAVRVLDTNQREHFLDWVNHNDTTSPPGLYASGNTPTHQAYIAAGDYYRLSSPQDVNGPWASVPGKTLAPVLSCRKSYNLLMTDGGWNHSTVGTTVTRGGGNADGTALMLPDGTNYDVTLPETRIFRDEWGGSTLTVGRASGTLSTMADLAFYYWATDLTGLPRKVTPRIRKSGSETFTSGTSTVTVPEYWNPKNDPATWQHMTTYTIGFRDAASWPTTGNPYSAYPVWVGDTYSGSFADLITGQKTWPDPVGTTPSIGGVYNQSRKTELWHMAINSRGKFVPALTSQDLVNAFRDIMNEIVQDTTAPATSLAGSSRSTRQASALFSAGYRADNWTGYVRRDELLADTAAIDTDSSHWKWGAITDPGTTTPRPQTTADLMNAKDATWPASRVVLSHKTETTGGTTTSIGISWEWDNLSPAQQTTLKTVGGLVDSSATADETARLRVAYLRGDRSREADATPAGPFRTRTSRQGDIVNSKLWFLKGQPASGYTINNYAAFRSSNANRKSMLYVGGNDGMLHGFDADTGEEKLAYVPEGLHGSLTELTRTAYTHRYFVDGSPFTADAWNGTAWRTFLAGSLGAGGKGYFVLDVTDPSQVTATNAASVVMLDQTTGTDADIGYIMSEPVMERSDPTVTRQITRLNNNRWALVTGNGYNSASEKAVLLIQYLDGDRELLKITADDTGFNGNGLSAPRLVDLNGDRVPDVAYAGDLRGNLWKFDLNSASPASWKVAFSGVPLYTATSGTGGARQAITSAPVYLSHPQGGVMVVFGTGRTLSDADRNSTQTQTVYGVYDSTAIALPTDGSSGLGTVTLSASGSTPVTGGRAALVQQAIGATSVGSTTDTATSVYTVSSNPVNYTGSSPKRGWFLDLPVSRERVTENLSWFDGDLIDIRSTVPAIGTDPDVESCEVTTAHGVSYLTTLNAVNGNAPTSQIYAYVVPADGVKNGSRVQTGLGLGLRGSTTELSVGAPGTARLPGRNLLGKVTLRPSWRQLQ